METASDRNFDDGAAAWTDCIDADTGTGGGRRGRQYVYCRLRCGVPAIWLQGR